MAEILKLTIDEQENSIAVICIEGYINNQGGEKIARVTDELIEQGTTQVLLDLAKTRIVNSIGVSILIEIIRKIARINGKLAFCCLTPTIKKTFHIMGIDQHSGIYPDQPAALAALKHRA